MNRARDLATHWPALTGERSLPVDERKMFVLTLTLVLMTLGIELLAPFLSWKRILPNATIYLSELTLTMLVGLTVARMIVFDRIPAIMVLILGMTGIGAIVAAFEGQAGAATAWGWWQLFKYPLVGLALYLQPWWPANFSTWLLRGCLALLAFEAVVQLGQYATGETPGDDLAGSFGYHGVGPLALFTFLVLSLAFGHWLATDEWRILTGTVLVCALSNILAENKIFLVAALLLAVLTMSLYLYSGQRLQSLILYVLLFSLLAVLFVIVYNATVADVRGTRRIEEYFNLEQVQAYLDNTDYNVETGEYYLGRGLLRATPGN
ncbi:MAG: hypothetical protein R3E79_48015 [Caldilineaceae bacterium]